MTTYSGTKEFEGATFVKASFKGATLRFSDVSGVTMRSVDVDGLDIDSHDLFFGSLIVNGVDVVPLVDENRVIARHGLAMIRRSSIPGLRALVVASNLEGENVGEYDVGFKLAPRLNASGRMGHAREAVELARGHAEHLADVAHRAAAAVADDDGGEGDRAGEVDQREPLEAQGLVEEVVELRGGALVGEGRRHRRHWPGRRSLCP